MTPRSIRRAAERKARKAARKAERTFAANFQPVASATEALIEQEPTALWSEAAEPLLFAPSPLSAAQLAANQANAQHSCGPKSEAGKAASCMNNFGHGFTGVFSVLASEDQQAFDTLSLGLQAEQRTGFP